MPSDEHLFVVLVPQHSVSNVQMSPASLQSSVFDRKRIKSLLEVPLAYPAVRLRIASIAVDTAALFII